MLTSNSSRSAALRDEVRALHSAIYRPGANAVHDALGLVAALRRPVAAFTGLVAQKDGTTSSFIYTVDLSGGDPVRLTDGQDPEFAPALSPDGMRLALVRNRNRSPRSSQVEVRDPFSGDLHWLFDVRGYVEQVGWSPDGSALIALVEESAPDARMVRTGWCLNLTDGATRRVSPTGLTLWEIAWCGEKALIAISSTEAGEDGWYRSGLVLFDLDQEHDMLYATEREQIAAVRADPSGRRVLFIRSIASDRGLVAGELMLIEIEGREAKAIPANDLDVTQGEWLDANHLLVTGVRDFATVVARIDLANGRVDEVWSSERVSGGGAYMRIAPCDLHGGFLAVTEGFLDAPALLLVRDGCERSLASFDLGFNAVARDLAKIGQVHWRGRDGLALQGWLLQTRTDVPAPLVMEIHGGPVWQARSKWLMRWGYHFVLLLQHGYSLFLPNARGSTGRGQAFMRAILGEVTGADTDDFLAGLDHLIASGRADPARIGVMGVSYGGLMACWLPIRDPRFAAAVPISASTDHLTLRESTDIPTFVNRFVCDDERELAARSPTTYVLEGSTPTLLFCGGLDRSTPSAQAREFADGLDAHGVPNEVVVFPNEGHILRSADARMEMAARTLDWFWRFMPPTCA